MGNEGIYLNTVKAICKILTSNIQNGKNKRKTYPLKSDVRQGWPLSSSYPIVLKVLTAAIKQLNKRDQTGENLSYYIFAGIRVVP